MEHLHGVGEITGPSLLRRRWKGEQGVVTSCRARRGWGNGEYINGGPWDATGDLTRYRESHADRFGSLQGGECGVPNQRTVRNASQMERATCGSTPAIRNSCLETQRNFPREAGAKAQCPVSTHSMSSPQTNSELQLAPPETDIWKHGRRRSRGLPARISFETQSSKRRTGAARRTGLRTSRQHGCQGF